MGNKDKKFSVEYDSEHGVYKVSLLGEGHDEAAMAGLFCEFEDGIREQKRGRDVRLLIDLHGLEKHISLGARKAAVDFLRRHTDFKKIAISGASTAVKVITNFVMSASGKKNVRFFSSNSEALKWLSYEQ